MSGATSRRAWGWHSLDPIWAERPGAITRPLLDAGASVVAVERHPGRADDLAAEFGRRITLVRADAGDLRLPRRPFHVVANPPFAATSAILRRLLHPSSRLVSAHLVLDERAIDRWAGPRAPASARWRRDFTVTIGPRLPRQAFAPPPAVHCRVLTLRRADAVRRR